MNLYALAALMFIQVVVWIALTSWAFLILPDESLSLKISMSALFFLLPGGFFWLGYTLYLMNRLIQKVDDIVEPEIVESLKLRGDDWFFKFHRLTRYSLSAVSTRLNRRDFAHYNFEQLPRQLLVPLRVYQYWQWLIGVALVIGPSLMWIVEHYNWRPS